MGWRILADATMVLHFAFVAFVVAGGFLAWRWPRAIIPHLIAAGWGLAIALFRFGCPLTWVEDRARERAGDASLAGGFIDTYLTGVIYPERYLVQVQVLAAVAVAVSWTGVAVRLRTARSS
ncbi:hypothetical protein ACTI_83100 [Actinoplanes sp. OR16]|uniref:DUF2784 domain-containing protein n=1 Tax=Actinoplanes sp. OR16 TaxID=946334 RepID=UPI000F7130F2|nr:DUF2784 domain-containing protein [Actinoplanes sp. OR16]BBH71625.1 hypothetical protein ACTI_83100 [Actinoplanes sp. OR16]